MYLPIIYIYSTTHISFLLSSEDGWRISPSWAIPMKGVFFALQIVVQPGRLNDGPVDCLQGPRVWMCIMEVVVVFVGNMQ